jgi:RNA polymerase sigma-70 factor (ECF subfamily)
MESLRWFDSEQDPGPEAETVSSALAVLPPEQREVIVLRLWHGLTFESVAELQGISPNTAAGRYRYGLQKLRILLKEPDHELDERTGKLAAWIPPASALSEGQGGSV